MSEAHDAAAEAVVEDAAVADQAAEDTTLAQGDEQSGDHAAAEDAEADGEGGQPPKRKPTFQERMDEKTRLQREAERDRDFWREQAMRTSQPPPAPATQATEESEPDPNAYENGEYDVRFIRDHATFHAKKAFQEESAKAAADRERTERLSSFDAAAKAVAEKHPDFYETVGRDYGKAAALCTDAMREAILISQDGPSVAYHLASDPAEARRIAALHPLAQAMELGKLSARLAAPSAAPRNPATNAPPATPQVRGAGGRFAPGPRDDMSTEDWLAARNAQLGR